MYRIPESELILNPDGSIYHLRLHPEQIADTILTVGDPGRVPMISKYFDRIEHRVQKREFATHTGWLGNLHLTVISTGIGPDNLDIVMNEIDALVNIDLSTRTILDQHRHLDFIRIGTTGGLQESLPVGSLVASAYGIGLDNLLHFYRYQNTGKALQLEEAFRAHVPDLPVVPYAFEANRDLLNKIGRGMTAGITLTCPGFYAPQGRTLRAGAKLSMENLHNFSRFTFDGYRITNFEMETAALFGMANLLGHRALACNVVLANRFGLAFSKNPTEDVERLIRKVLENLSE